MLIDNLEVAPDTNKGDFNMGRISPKESARIITMLVISGESCDTCRHYAKSYGDCPWEPDAGTLCRNKNPLYMFDLQ